MKYSSSQARKLAQQIQDRFGVRIHEVTWGTTVPADFLASLISVEAGKDSRGQIKEDATRFEPHVYTKLKQVRDGKLLQYNKIRRAQIKDASDESLRALATSCGLTQIMQWWSIHLGISVAELRGPNHLKHAVKLLEMTAAKQLADVNYEGALRIWNTGRPTGKTHDPAYVENATAVMDAYAELEPVDIVFKDNVIVDGGAINLGPTPAKPESEKPSVETVAPNAPEQKEESISATGVTVQKVAQSLASKIMAGGTLVTGALTALFGAFTGLIRNPFAFALLIIGCAAIAGYLYNQSKERQLRLQLDLNAKAASPQLNTVVVNPPPPKT